jgi:HPt (histidine-containing phosphotransfer) domain-containing protein
MEIKLSNLRSLLDCDDTVLKKLMESFIEETDQCMNVMEESLVSEDYMKMRGASHKMIGSCYIFEFDEMVQLLKKLEHDAEKKINLDEMPAVVSQLKTLHEEVKTLMHQSMDANFT